MALQGWKQLLAGAPWFHKPGAYPIPAYSEFMPPPRVGCLAYAEHAPPDVGSDDPFGWPINEYEQAFQLEPGLHLIAQELLGALRHLGHGEPAHGIAQNKLAGNPYWPDELRQAVPLKHERFVTLSALALSRSQDDKGRVRWTLFGGSEQGPSRAFWRSFFYDPRQEQPEEQSLDFIRRLLHAAYHEPWAELADLHRAGFRVLPCEEGAPRPEWNDRDLPSWIKPYLFQGRSLAGIRYLLTFCPFGKLPAGVRRSYLAGELHLLPFPGSLVFWGAAPYLKLAEELPLAVQIPLLHSIERHAAPLGIRVPQSGWLHEPRPGAPAPSGLHGPLRNTYRRTHRWARVHREDDELAVSAQEDRVAHVLFSTAADDLGLYGKPMARNAQLWTRDCELLLDGPKANRKALVAAARQLAGGGLFGYRFQFPAMRVGQHEVYWQRPLVAYIARADSPPVVLDGAPLGYFTAYNVTRPKLDRPIELWPRLQAHETRQLSIQIYNRPGHADDHRAVLNIRKLLDAHELWQAALEPSFARSLLTAAKDETLDDWFRGLSVKRTRSPEVRALVGQLQDCVADEDDESARPKSLTFGKTAKRAFEKEYWSTIAELSTGQYRNKVNADCVTDEITQSRLAHDHRHNQRDLEALGDHLLEYYHRLIEKLAMTGQARAGELPFTWQTEFDYGWQGGWVNNQSQATYERNLLMMIPGRDRSRAVIMADHYDTAYMEDEYGYGHGGHGPRLAAAGADDNHSATATLMLGAPVFMELSRQGKLACDVWLVHLTGEEFPADCLGARHLAQCLVEGTLELREPKTKRKHDLSSVRVQGVYVLDMVAHNNDRNRNVFQICPGTGRESLWLAYQAHVANRTWNKLAAEWNEKPARRGRGPGQRSADAITLPAVAEHPHLHGEVRPTTDPRSTLYNTDGQIFSDAGVPVVLFMENYDINRKGYHDTHDTLANIDLDYGSAVAAIAIETVARAASEVR